MNKNLSIPKRNYLVLILLSFLRFAGDSFFYGFLTRYFDSLDKTIGYGDAKLGLLLSIIPFMAIVGNIVLSKFATSMKKNRVFLLVWTAIEGTCIIISGTVTDYWFVLLVDVICNFCSNSYYNLLDTFILPIMKSNNKTYASGRFFGTLAYIGGTFLGGIAINELNYKYTFIIGGALMIASGIAFLFINTDDLIKEEAEESKNEKAPTYKEVFSNKKFVPYMIFAAVLIGSIWGSDNIYGLYTGNKYAGSLNIPTEVYGYFYSATVAVEALTLAVFSRFKKISYMKWFMFVAYLSSMLRLVLFAIPGMNQYVYLGAEVLRGITYGMVLTCNLNLLQNILGKRLMYKGFFLTVALDELLAAVIDIASPSIISATSFTFMFSICIGICLIGFSFFFLLKFNPDEDAKTLVAPITHQNTAPIDKQ
jgi:MFS family permease